VYTLNLLFDLSRVNGRFSGDAQTSSGPLSTSMNWLRLRIAEPADPNPPAFNPERNNIWDDLQEAASTLLLSLQSNPGNICIRLAPDPDVAAPPNDIEVRLVVCFGRPTKARQPQASPFTRANGVVTTFFRDFTPMNSPRGLTAEGAAQAGNLAWFFPLGVIAPQTRPNDRNKTHRYEFAVGVVARSASAGIERHYGEDPEMDLGD
jgi:hypothetical protein